MLEKQYRKLTEKEFAIFEKLMEKDFSGRDVIQEQVLLSEVTEHTDGSGTLFFKIPTTVKKAEVKQRVPVEGRVETENVTMDILLHVLDGTVSELEFVRYKDDGNNVLPEPELIVVE
ncbi:hypothetical protein IPH92_02130 [Candidatus Kaiserbacteria bacterium]|nr:MAG: hypothetical protein IPH92_02130 [Candidatus Kaiserbacteria bacterium]